MATHLVKLIHASQLQQWQCFPVYESYAGKTMAQFLAETKSEIETTEPILFISHRWKSLHHPDPDGYQLEKLKALRNCYLIYDYTSFPQDTTTQQGKEALREVLAAMNSLIDNVVVISDPDYLNRGWCLYEYISASLRNRIVCDEIKDPSMVRLRNVMATHPNPPGIGSTHREAVNAKNQFILEAVNDVLPVFGRSGFTVPSDKGIVQHLLIDLLRRCLPKKQEYTAYVGEWKAGEWTNEELAAAFESKLHWEPLSYDPNIPIFSPAVPDNISKAVATGYRINKQPEDFDSKRYEMDFSGINLLFFWGKLVIGVIILALLVWGIYYVALMFIKS